MAGRKGKCSHSIVVVFPRIMIKTTTGGYGGGRHRSHRRAPASTPKSSTNPLSWATSASPRPAYGTPRTNAATSATTAPSSQCASTASTTARVFNVAPEASSNATTTPTTSSAGGAPNTGPGGVVCTSIEEGAENVKVVGVASVM